MSVFNAYARYYDLLYRDKDYAGEATFVDNVIRSLSNGQDLLELGCGTGKHAIELAQKGWTVSGVDLSDAMVGLAVERANPLPETTKCRLDFRQGDVRSVRLERTFDAVISLFHVMSYQTSNEDLEAAIQTANTHLRPGGVFLFDFWYGPAVLSDPPVVRVKRLSDEVLEVTRLAEPEMRPNENQVNVNYHVFLKNKSNGEYSEIRETHPMRYLFLPEIKLMLAKGGFELIQSGAWCSDRQLGCDAWYGFAVGKKQK